MLRRLYRAILLAKAASAANKSLAKMSDRVLADIGQSRDTFVRNFVQSVREELDREDRKMAGKKLAKTAEAPINPNLVGAV